MTCKDMIRFRDSVAADVSEQYPQLECLDVVVERAIEKRAEILGWIWTAEGPKHKQGGEG
jgi:hypothetical protein